MAIIHWAHKLEDIPAGAANVRPFEHDAMNSDRETVVCRSWSYQTHVGLCLEDRERNGYHDSDFYMVVWNPETMTTENIEYGTTRGYCGPAMGSFVDATPEVRAAYLQHLRERQEAARREHQKRLDAMPSKGRTVRVVKGRKVPVGTVGRVGWSSVAFKTDKVLGILFLGYEGRVGIDTPTGRVFTDVGNVELAEASAC